MRRVDAHTDPLIGAGRCARARELGPWTATKSEARDADTCAQSHTLQMGAGRDACARSSPRVVQKRLDWPALTRRPLLAEVKSATFGESCDGASAGGSRSGLPQDFAISRLATSTRNLDIEV